MRLASREGTREGKIVEEKKGKKNHQESVRKLMRNFLSSDTI
jgi:hypothetical protein